MVNGKKNVSSVWSRSFLVFLVFLIMITSVLAVIVDEKSGSSSGSKDKNFIESMWSTAKNVWHGVGEAGRATDEVTGLIPVILSLVPLFVVGFVIGAFARFFCWLIYTQIGGWPIIGLIKGTRWFGILYLRTSLDNKIIHPSKTGFFISAGVVYTIFKSTGTLFASYIGKIIAHPELATTWFKDFFAMLFFSPFTSQINNASYPQEARLAMLIGCALWFVCFPSILTFFWKYKGEVMKKENYKKIVDRLKRKAELSAAVTNANAAAAELGFEEAEFEDGD